jgi:hypothetical protein
MQSIKPSSRKASGFFVFDLLDISWLKRREYMLMTFKSRASSDVAYFKEIAMEILALLGKDPGALQGIFTVEQLDSAILTLKGVMDADKHAPVDIQNNENEDRDDAKNVRLYQRAFPLLTLFERSKAAKQPVIWGM